MWITMAAVASWCFAAYMMPIVALVVCYRRRKDKTEIIQVHDVGDEE